MTYEPIKGPSRRYFGLLTPIETLLLLGLMPLAPRQYLYRRVEEGGTVALEVLNRWFFQDSIHRYDFRDIQAITVRRSRAGMWMSVSLALFLAMSGSLLALATAYQVPLISIILLWILTSILTVLALVNLALGPTCVCELHTRVNKERLYCLGRWRSARRTVEAMIRDIEAVQGVTQAPPESGDVVCAQDSVPKAQLERLSLAPVPTTTWHRAFFALMVLMAVSSAADLMISNDWKNLGDITLFCILLLTGSFALTKQRHDGVGRRPYFHPTAKRCTTSGLAALLAIYYVFQILATLETLTNQGPEILTAGFISQPGEISIFLVSITNILVLTPLGVFGLWGLANPPRRELAGQGPPDVA